MIVKVYQLLVVIGIVINIMGGLFLVNPSLNNGWFISNEAVKVLFMMSYIYLGMLFLMFILNYKSN